MDGVATEIPQKVAMLLKDDGLHAGTGEQEARHHSGGTATGDAEFGRV